MSSGFRFRMIARAASQTCWCSDRVRYYLLFLEGKSTCNARPGNRMDGAVSRTGRAARSLTNEPRFDSDLVTAIWGSGGSLEVGSAELWRASRTARHQELKAYPQNTGTRKSCMREPRSRPAGLMREYCRSVSDFGPSRSISSAIGSHVG